MSDRRTQILEAAREILVEEGYDSLTTNRVAEAVGVTSAGIHYHFETKEELLVALIDSLREQLSETLASHDGPPEERLAAVVRRQFEMAEAVRELTAPPGIQLVVAGARPGPVQAALVSYVDTYVDHVTDVIEDGVASGVFETDDPRRVATFLASATDSAAVRSALDLSLDPLAESLTAHVLDDLYVAEPPEVGP
ncbi:TetR/AcrR family transcriptional regulator [Halobaculum sp. MBLA0147]|uniref:TetR/AcrR family transcriptional regulator n=1 Tax=Halobaculum sp. MBLA0147 TaxID=3079934 RepID=UPI00352330E8